MRAYQIDKYPLQYNGDDQTHAMVGASILSNDHVPAGTTLFISDNPSLFWFSHVDYYDTVRRYDFRLSEPYVDQPTLAITIVGLLPKFFGYDHFQPLPQTLVAIPALLAGIASMYLVFLLADKLLNKYEAILAVVFYSFSPYVIFAHRQAQLESFLTPVYLLALLLLLQFIKNKNNRTLFFLSFICMIAGFIKLIGLIVPVLICFWLIKEKRFKAALVIFSSLLASIAILLLYYAKIDMTQFIQVLQLQTQQGRSMYLGSLWKIISDPHFYEPFADGWYFFGFLSLFIFGFSSKDFNHRFISVNAILILLSVLFTTGLYNNFPWYRYPLLPFISLASGWLVWDMLRRPRISTFVLFLFFMLGNIEILGQNFASLRSALPVKTILVLLLTPSLLYEIWQKPYLKKLINFTVIVVLCISIAVNTLIVLSYPNSRCIDVHCVIPLKVVVSGLQEL